MPTTAKRSQPLSGMLTLIRAGFVSQIFDNNYGQVLPPDVYKRLKDHLAWVKGEMQTWITADQAGRGLYADYLYNAITGNWERKRPVWAMLMVNGLTASDIASR